MEPLKWNPYRVLGICSRNSIDMKCIGTTIHRSRCRWDISASNFRKVSLILSEIGSNNPKDAAPYLDKLAELCLCTEYHRNKVYVVKESWKESLKDAREEYEAVQEIKEQKELLEKQIKEIQYELQVLKIESGYESGSPKVDLKEYDSALARYAELERMNVKLSTSVSQLQTRSNNEEEVSRRAIHNLDGTINTLQLRFDEQGSISERWHESLMTLITENTNLTAELKALQLRVTEQLEDSVWKTREFESLKASQDEISKENDILEDALYAACQKIGEIDEKLDQVEISKEDLSNEAGNLLLKLATEEETTTRLTYQVDSVESELHSTRQTLQHTASQLKITEQELLAVSYQVVELERSLVEATEATSRSTHEQAVLRSQLAAQEDHASTLLQDLETAKLEASIVKNTLQIKELALETAQKSNKETHLASIA